MIGVFISVFKIIMFSVVGGLFYGQSTRIPPGGQKSLWSVSCNADNTSKAVFAKVINLGQFCSMQVRCSFPDCIPGLSPNSIGGHNSIESKSLGTRD